MANWVTVEIRAAREVLDALINEEGKVDFNLIHPYGAEKLKLISLNAEFTAKGLLGIPLNPNPFIANLVDAAVDYDIKDLSEEELEQLLVMVRNYHKVGYLHQMEFAREKWGTKWNAFHSRLDEDEGVLYFQTAWSYPEPLIAALSEKFPSNAIEVNYADEDIGANCGNVIFKCGKVLSFDEPSLDEIGDDYWVRFACEVMERSSSL